MSGRLASYDVGLLALGLSPFAILLLAGLLVVGYLFASRFDDAKANSELGLIFGGALATVMAITLLLCVLCVQIRPRELFVDAAGVGLDASDEAILLRDISAAEAAVCKLITRADGFIQNDGGKAGQDDPALVSAAQQKARADLDMVTCGDPATETLDIAHRLTRLESTLAGFTGPEFKRTYDATVPCREGFIGATAGSSNPRVRLTAIQATIAEQQQKLLGPIDAKTAAMQRGDLSDCDRRRGAKTATAASIGTVKQK